MSFIISLQRWAMIPPQGMGWAGWSPLLGRPRSESSPLPLGFLSAFDFCGVDCWQSFFSLPDIPIIFCSHSRRSIRILIDLGPKAQQQSLAMHTHMGGAAPLDGGESMGSVSRFRGLWGGFWGDSGSWGTSLTASVFLSLDLPQS